MRNHSLIDHVKNTTCFSTDKIKSPKIRKKMSYCREEGKDRIIFVTKEDHEKPSTALITTKDDDEEEEPGLILKDGTINWNCPCLGGMASGPCGIQFREAFSCFHYSDAEPKGSNCFEPFKTMQDCMSQYPDLYPKDEEESKDPLANAPDKLEENVTQETNNPEPVKEQEETSSKAIAPDALPTEKVPVKATS